MNKQQFIYLNLLFVFLLTPHINVAQVQWGVRVGMNVANSDYTDSGGNEAQRENIVNMHLGMTLDIPVLGFFVQPSLMYQGKGFKGNNAWAAVTGEENEFQANLSYIVLPVNLIFKPKLGTSGRLLLGAGPYLGYGLGGKWKSNRELLYDDIMIAQTEGDIRFTKDGSEGDMGTYNYGKPWDYGFGFLLGYEILDRYYFQLNGELGLANLQYSYGEYNSGGVLKNRVFGWSLGYKF